jgi:2-(1,2-epoxy-1,2-dihydrophenyl)acetyl-CoA isomerase
MAFFGETIDAAIALDWGLVNEVVDPETLYATAIDWGRRLANGPTTALSLMKTLIDGSATASFEAALEGEARAQHIVYTTNDMQEGIRAYLERREPRFTGN